MKSKKLKKIIIISAICVVLIIGITIGVIALNQNSRRAYIQRVEDLNMVGMSMGQSFYGQVVESAQQKVFAGTDKKIDEVFVSEGDKVSKGDKLFRYDTVLLELNVEEKQLTVNISETTLNNEKQKLENYKNIVPVADVPIEEPTVPEETPTTVSTETVAEEPEQAEAEESTEKTYTAQEKADLITDQELAVSRAQNQLDSAKEDLAEAQSALDEAIVTAKLDGTVNGIQDPASIESSVPFCTIIGNTGVTIKGYVSEFDLNSLKTGDTLNVSSNMTDATTNAEVLTVSDYPSDSFSGGYDNGNPNTSYYEFSAFMDQSEGFDIGEDVRINKQEADTPENVIVLSKAYVRADSSGYYVLKDTDGKLERQEVKVSRGSDAEYVTITEGLSLDDMIAFPYGSKGKEGLPTTTEQAGPSIL